MGPLIGRTNELRSGVAILEAARSQQVARLLRIVGVSGIGKTAIARALATAAANDGWVVAFAAAHRIQAALPFTFARRIQAAILEALGPAADRYASGLSLDDPESALLRLLEAIVIDRPLALIADDAQWADHESRALLARVLQALADRPLALISTERIDEIDRPAFELSDAAVLVTELDERASEALARMLLPNAPDPVVRAVVEHGRGRAIDIVALAGATRDPSAMTIEDVTSTLRILVAKDLTLMNADAREFLQICSLISDPIDYALLQQIWPDQSALVGLIQAVSGRYLLQSGGALHFVHAAIGQSVRETIAIEIPYRRRIFEALMSLPVIRLEDIERLVDQARSMGDRDLEKKQLLRLIDEAARVQSTPVAARALERVLEITPFNAHESIALYARLSVFYNALSRDGDTHRICAEALDYARSHGIKADLGQIILSDLFALFFRGQFREYDRTIERFEDYLETPTDCGYLAIGKLFRALYKFDGTAHDQAVQEFQALDIPDPTLQIRIDVFSGTHIARTGEIERGLAMIERAKTNAQLLRPILGIMAKTSEVMLVFPAFGSAHPRTQAALGNILDAPTSQFFSALTLLHNGQFVDAVNLVGEALVVTNGVYVRRQLLNVAASAATLSDMPLAPALRSAVLGELSAAETDGVVGAQLGMAAYASYSGDGPQALLLLRSALDFTCRQPLEPMTFFAPFTLVKAAQKLGHRETLETIAAGDLACDALALNRAHHDLARFAAIAALGKKVAADDAVGLSERFAALGASYFAARAQGLTAAGNAETGSPVKLTRREREVADLVASGLTNREIAEKLVLSERTVEAHIANIFSKVGASTRSQVASWYIRQAAHAV